MSYNPLEDLVLDDEEIFPEKIDPIEINKDINTIKYDIAFNRPNNFIPKEISFEDINNYDFSKGFNEFIIGQEYVHLYFDFDSITSEDDYKDVINWLDSLKPVFGTYSIGGYCNNKDMEKYGFRYIENEQHYLSMHVIYFITRISSEDLVNIMKHTEKKGFAYDGVHKLCDPNVYKLVAKVNGQKSRQVFRHVLSDKIFKPNDPKNRKNHGYILNNLTPDTQIVQTRGDEPIINKDMWNSLFKLKPSKTEVRNQIKNEKKERNFDIDDINFTDELIKFNKDELLELLHNFSPEFNVYMHDLAPLYHSPYSKDFLRDLLIEWYSTGKHEHDIDTSIDGILDKYYTKENNNKWFYSLIKQLPVKIMNKYLKKYGNSSIDFTININNSNYTFEKIRRLQYEKYEFSKLINSLRGVIGIVKSRIYIKELKDEQVYIRETSITKIRDELSLYKPFKNNTKITLYHIIYKFSNWFLYDDSKIMAKNNDPENIINIFQGFKFNESTTDDFTILEPLLDHIKTIVCNNDDKKYDYFMKWWANIFQNITVKNGTMPIIYGAQGSGKSFPIECFCELLGNFALRNVDDLDKVFGKFNGLIGRHLVININEPPEATEKFKYLGKIKSKLTQKRTVQETKGVDQIEIDSWANYLMSTNNPNPVQEEKGDRRLIYYEANNKYCGNEKYFNKLCKPIQPIPQGPYVKEYMEVLLHYMRTQIDISNFNPEKLIREINSNTNVEYNEQLERQYLDLNAVDRYIVDNYYEFLYGIPLEDIKVNGYKSTGLARKLNSICNVKRIRVSQFGKIVLEHSTIYGGDLVAKYVDSIDVKKEIDGKKQIRIYTLKSKEQIPDLYAIIDYKLYNDKLCDEEEDTAENNDVENNDVENNTAENKNNTIENDDDIIYIGDL